MNSSMNTGRWQFQMTGRWVGNRRPVEKIEEKESIWGNKETSTIKLSKGLQKEKVLIEQSKEKQCQKSQNPIVQKHGYVMYVMC